MPGDSGATVVTTVCTFFCTRAAGALGTRHSPRPLFFKGRKNFNGSGATRGEGAEVCLGVIARSEATRQSTLSLRREMDCFASLAMTNVNDDYNDDCLGSLKIESVLPEHAAQILRDLQQRRIVLHRALGAVEA